MPTLEVKDLTLNYAIKGGTLQALAPVNMTLPRRDFVVALGASGCWRDHAAQLHRWLFATLLR